MKTIRSKILSTALLLSLTWAGLAHANPSDIFGSWKSEFSIPGFTIDMKLDIQANQMQLTNTCTFQGQSATAAVSVPVQITDTQIIVAQPGMNSALIPGGGGASCNVQVAAGPTDYRLHDGSLDIYGNGQTLTFSKAR